MLHKLFKFFLKKKTKFLHMPVHQDFLRPIQIIHDLYDIWQKLQLLYVFLHQIAVRQSWYNQISIMLSNIEHTSKYQFILPNIEHTPKYQFMRPNMEHTPTYRLLAVSRGVTTLCQMFTGRKFS